MGKRKWLLLFVLFSFLSVGAVVRGTNPFDYLGKTELAEVYNDQDEQKPEVKIGEPFNIEQCLPSNIASGNFRVFLGEAVKNRVTGATKDKNGDEIVPEGHVFHFYNTQEDAVANKNAISEILFIERFDPATSPITKWLRVQSVVNPQKNRIISFQIIVKTENCKLDDKVTGRPDLFKCADDSGIGTFSLTDMANYFYYGQESKLYEVVNGNRGKEITIDKFKDYEAQDGQVIEVEVKEAGETVTRRFTLYAESVNLNSNEVSLHSLETKVEGGKVYGKFNLNEARAQLLSKDENVGYYIISFFKNQDDADRNQNAIATNEPIEMANGSNIYTRILNKLSRVPNACPNTKKTISLLVTDKLKMPELENLTYCDSNLQSYSLVLTNQNKVMTKWIQDEFQGTFVTYEEAGVVGFDPKGKYTVGYFNTKADAEANQNRIIGAEIVVNINEAREIWTRLTELETGNYNTAFFYASLGYDDISTYKFDKKNFRFCQSDKENEGQYYFVNLRAYDYYSLGNFVIKPQPPLYPEGANVTVAYYRSEEDALADINRIPEEIVTKYPIKMGGSSDLLWAKVVMKEGFGCSASNASSFYATLGTSPEVEYYPTENRLQLCKNSDNGEVSDLTLGVTNKDHKNREIKVTWQKREYNATNNSYWFSDIKTIETAPFEYNVTEAGTYRALVNFKKEPFGLSKEDETTEDEKPAEGVEIVSCNVNNVWTVEDFMSVVVENTDSTGMINSLDVNEQGQAAVVIGLASGTTSGYEFRIDTGAFQPSSHFYNVPIGEHTAWVRDIVSGCSAFTTFSVFGYPKFFTPNGDGYNDTWNIPGLQGHPEARIYIYDRYGKLIKQMSPQGEGWDGTFNGKQLPSTDYWFTVEFTTDFVANKELDGRKVSYKGHFSLKR